MKISIPVLFKEFKDLHEPWFKLPEIKERQFRCKARLLNGLHEDSTGYHDTICRHQAWIILLLSAFRNKILLNWFHNVEFYRMHFLRFILHAFQENMIIKSIDVQIAGIHHIQNNKSIQTH